MEELQAFDLNEHVTATILFDDSEDETMDVKPNIKDIAQNENRITEAAQEPKVVTDKSNSTLPLPNLTETVTVKHLSKNLEVLHKPLDMPILEEENIGSVHFNNISTSEIITNKNVRINTGDNRKIHVVNEEIIQKGVIAFFNSSNKCNDSVHQTTAIQPLKNIEVLNENLSNYSDKSTRIKSVNNDMSPNKNQIKESTEPTDHAQKNITNFTENKNISCNKLDEPYHNDNRLHVKFLIANEELSKRRKTSRVTEHTIISNLKENYNLIGNTSQKKDCLPIENRDILHRNLNKTTNDCDLQNKRNTSTDKNEDSKSTHGIVTENLLELNSPNHNINDELNRDSTYEKEKVNKSQTDFCSKVTCNQPLSNKRKKDELQESHTEVTDNNLTLGSANGQQSLIESNIMTQPLNKNMTPLANYIMELLNTVSEHMICIFISYESYVKLHYRNSDLSLMEMAKNNYIRTKNHFFDLSYSSVLNIIIPRKNDSNFVEKFLANTIAIGKSKSVYFSYEQIQPLYLDMIKWVQKRQTQIQNMNINSTTHPILTQELLRPSKPLNVNQDSIQSQSTSNNSKTSNVATNHFPESSTSLQVNPFIEARPHIMQPLQIPIQHNKPPPPYQNYSHRYSETRQLSTHYNFQPPRYSEQNVSTLPRYMTNQQYTQRRYYENHVQSTTYPVQNTNIILKETNQNLPDQPDLQPCENRKVSKQGTEIDPAKAHSPWQQSSTEQSNLHSYNCQNYVPSSTVQSIYPNHHETNSAPNNQYVRLEIATPAETNRSSISRDSGFMSPLNFNASGDVSLQEEQRSITTPVITHVTSLNPQASLIADGNCFICGKTTKQKCLGCFKVYYCSHDCQVTKAPSSEESGTK